MYQINFYSADRHRGPVGPVPDGEQFKTVEEAAAAIIAAVGDNGTFRNEARNICYRDCYLDDCGFEIAPVLHEYLATIDGGVGGQKGQKTITAPDAFAALKLALQLAEQGDYSDPDPHYLLGVLVAVSSIKHPNDKDETRFFPKRTVRLATKATA